MRRAPLFLIDREKRGIATLGVATNRQRRSLPTIVYRFLTLVAPMTHIAARMPIQSAEMLGRLDADPAEFGRLLGPVIAGARARGLADAFELMGLAAVLIDDAGRVLSVSGRAERVLLPLVRVIEGHMIGADTACNRQIQDVIALGLRRDGDLSSAPSVSLADAEGRDRMTLRVLRVRPEGDPALQLLRAVVIVSEAST